MTGLIGCWLCDRSANVLLWDLLPWMLQKQWLMVILFIWLESQSKSQNIDDVKVDLNPTSHDIDLQHLRVNSRFSHEASVIWPHKLHVGFLALSGYRILCLRCWC